MKLGVLLDYWQRAGGAERHTLALMRRAQEEGDQVSLATLEVSGPNDVEMISIKSPKRRPHRDRHFALAGHEALKQAGCDAVLAIRHALKADVYLPHGGLVLDARTARHRARVGEHQRARRERGLSRKEAFFVEAEQAMLGHESGPQVIAVSRMAHTRMLGVYPRIKERAMCVLNGVDSDHFQAAPHAKAGQALRASLGLSEALVGVFLASNLTLKGAFTAVRMLAEPRLRELSCPFHLLLGGRVLPRRILRLARRLGVRDRIHSFGVVEDPRPIYAAADVLIHPTWFDPCSLVCLEALSMGLPVITTPQNGVRDIMGQRGGIVVETPGDPEALAVAVAVLADDSLRAITADDARYLARRNREVTRLDRILDVCRRVGE